MARAISKGISTSIVYGFDPMQEFDTDTTGIPQANVTVEVQGVPSQAKAFRELAKVCGHKNVMVFEIVTNEINVTLDSDTFIANSFVCENGVSYGLDYVVQQFVTMSAVVLYRDDNGNVWRASLEYAGDMSDSRFISYAREIYGQSACVMGITRDKYQRYMTKKHYLELATEK